MKRSWTITSVIVAGLLLIAVPSTAEADDGIDPDPAIAQAMSEIPGGVLVDETHAYWPAMDLELSVVDESGIASRSAVGSCDTSKICAYLNYGLTGMYASWGTCGVLTLPSTYELKSLANARSTGYAQARNGTTVVATATAGGWANVYGATTNVRCVL